MTVQPDADPAATPPGGDEGIELFHIMCCADENLGLCGIDLTDVPVVESCPEDDQDCVVCEDISPVVGEGTKCPGCPTTMQGSGVWGGA